MNTHKAEAIANSLRSQFTPHPILYYAFAILIEVIEQNILNADTKNTLIPATSTGEPKIHFRPKEK